MTDSEFQLGEPAAAGQPESSGGTQGPEVESPPSYVSSQKIPSQTSQDPHPDREPEINKELRRLNRALRALSACNKALAQAGSEQELLDQICDVIVRLGEYRLAWIGYAEQDEAKTVRVMAFAGDDDGDLQGAFVSWSDVPSGRGSVGTAIRENRAVVISNVVEDPRFAPWRDWALKLGYGATIGLPLRVAGAPFGALAIYAQQPGSFESSEIELLEEIADNLAYGITAIRTRDENRRAEATLKETQAKYRQLVEEVPAISYVAEAGAQGPFVYVSPQVKTILGFRPEDCLADPRFWWEHLNPEDHPVAAMEDAWKEGEPFQVEYRMRRQDGQEVWLRDDAAIFRDSQTGKRMTRGLLIDITEQKRANEALRRSEENYRRFVAQSSEGIFRLDLDHPIALELPPEELVRQILYGSYMAECNEAMARMYGMGSPLQFFGKRLTEVVPPDDPRNVELAREYVRNGFRVVDRESHEVDVHGTRRIFLNSLFGIVEHGKLLRTWGIQRDITERLRAEEARNQAEDALRESEERYRAFVTQSSEGIFRMEYDPPVPCRLPIAEQLAWGWQHGYMAECNDATARMYGLASAQELIGKPLSEFLVLHHPVTRKFMEDFIGAGYRITDQESREIDAYGRKRIFRNTMVGTITNGHWVRSWGITRDVTERLQLEEQLRNAQQLEAVGRLAGGVAHDFNNILSIIMGHGELLLAAGADERARNGLEQIQRAADRAASLTQQLLAFSRKQVLQPKVLDLNEAVADVQKMLARVIGEDIALVANLHPSLMSVKADPGQVEQVLMNLAINARDAMPQGGTLSMQTSNIDVTAGQGCDFELAPGPYVMLRVTDSGHGMDAETLSHIFEPFFTTKPMGKGTGLGLATVYGIVKQSGGSIQVDSDPGRGSEFRIYLPAAGGAMRKEAMKKVDQQVAGGSETILVAEDEADLLELTRIFLEGYGYTVLQAGSAEQALMTAQASTQPIHLLLTDVIMPGMSGRQLAERILSTRPETKIVYMTGYTDDMVVQHKVLEPGVRLLQKPFTKIDLAMKVRATLDGR